jgi:hypothetical protein
VSNAFDDLPPISTVQAAQSGQQANAFDDISPPVQPPAPKVPVTARDRAHAAEGGILGGLAYTATSIPDAVANLYKLGKAGLGAGYQAVTGNAGWDAGEPFPVGRWLTSKMDKNELTSTQAPRPDDTASRYLNTAGNVAGGVVAGNPLASPAQMGRSLAVATPGALAGRAVAEAKPFQNESANTTASILAQALGTRAAGGAFRQRGALLPENQMKNDAVTQGQEQGFQFPPATTNPTKGNQLLENAGGKTSIAQHMAINNQKVVNEGARADMGLPSSKGSAVTDLEIETAKANAAPGYNALRNAGTITPPSNFQQQLAAALSKQSGAGMLSKKLADPELAGIVDDLKKNSTFEAGDAMDAIDALRDKKTAAYNNGQHQAGKAYKGVSDAIENAIDSDLKTRGGSSADLINNFRDSRQKFAIINSVEENRNAASGNVLNQKLAAALKRGDYLSGNLEIAGKATGQAEKSGAFAEPTKTAGNHLSLIGSMLAAPLAAHQFLPESLQHAGVATALAASAVPLGRFGARQYVQGLGQHNALPRTIVPITNPNVLGGAYAAGAENSNR